MNPDDLFEELIKANLTTSKFSRESIYFQNDKRQKHVVFRISPGPINDHRLINEIPNQIN